MAGRKTSGRHADKPLVSAGGDHAQAGKANRVVLQADWLAVLATRMG